ncbi:5-formyltetrahydrofolate cyclo-ligase [Prevotella sp. KH2C16]|uniref:5-formyltetrahydrofolate cyclo-ligase n=1 Tax=Prevotella sp. KH2C16 TaxID=1855325 RepID=UPI000B0EEF8C|nr:5-formyltetrahydrofolate cyclo-ligase [Prevotella sp. KH2C16]
MLKKKLREEIRRRKRQFTREQLRERSLPIVARLLAHPRIREAETVLLYYSLPDEVDTHNMADELLRQGKTVLLPVVMPRCGMQLRRYEGRGSMREDEFHILEPTGKPFTDYAQISVAVIPGMSFDARGNRLGRGKGYYDRFLKQLPHTYKIGVCFDFQRLEQVPVGANDIPMDEVVS